MRMRKKKWAEPYLEAHGDYAISNPSDYSGKWKELTCKNELHVEIGAGKGGYMLAMSLMYPDAGWIGIERDHSAAAVACRKAIEERGGCENRRLITGNAEEMENWFSEGEIDVIHLNFSDPWPKKRNHKKRLSSERFLSMYKKLLSEKGYILMKTDNKDLFEDSVISFLANGFTLTEISVDYRRNEHPEDAITEYEQKFLEEGMPIYHLTAVPVKEQSVIK